MSEAADDAMNDAAPNNDNPYPTAPDAAALARTRERILRRFERWLDAALASQPPPEGVDAELLAELLAEPEPETAPPGVDLYSLWSAMTALREEVRIQGRHFKTLSDTLAPLAGLEPAVGEALEAHAEALEEARRLAALAQQARGERDRDARRDAQRPVVLLLIDMRDRLERGLESARSALELMGSPIRSRWMFLRVTADATQHAAEAARALRQGYELTLASLAEGLEQFGVRPVGEPGQPFDPRWMNAADVAETDAAPEGTVLEVYRNGYTWNGEPLRPAQVKVARAPKVDPIREGDAV